MAVPNTLDANVDRDILTENSSRLMIILYILKKYKPPENINIVYTKVDTALALLSRMGIIGKVKLNGDYGADSDLEDESCAANIPQTAQSPTDAMSNETPEQKETGKKKVVKDVLKNHNSAPQKSSPKSNNSPLPTGDLREKLNAKRNKMSSDSLSFSNVTSPSNNVPSPLLKKEANKTWIGTKTNGVTKISNGNIKCSSDKILKLKKTKDKVKKSASNSTATKENQKTKANKGKNIKNSEKAKQKSPVDKNGKTVRQFRLKRLSPELAAICGKKKLSRQDVVSRMWRYIKKKQLQDPNQRTTIVCDEKLKALTKKPSIAQSDMLLCIGSHLTLIN